MNDAVKADCFKCKYYAVTWNPKMPKSCKYFGFKSAQLPSIVVSSSTGEPCMAFIQKDMKSNN